MNNKKKTKKNKNITIKENGKNIEFSEIYLQQLKSIANSSELVPKESIENLKKRKRGRPPKYQIEMCQQVLDYMSKGLSKNSVAVLLGIAHKTLLEWEKKYKEFKDAIEVGEQLSKHWWEEQGRLNIHNQRFNATLYMMNMTNRFDWTRRLDGKLKVDETHTEKKILEIKISNKDEDKAEILKILNENGALKEI